MVAIEGHGRGRHKKRPIPRTFSLLAGWSIRLFPVLIAMTDQSTEHTHGLFNNQLALWLVIRLDVPNCYTDFHLSARQGFVVAKCGCWRISDGHCSFLSQFDRCEYGPSASSTGRAIWLCYSALRSCSSAVQIAAKSATMSPKRSCCSSVRPSKNAVR